MHFKWMNSLLCKFYFNTAIFKWRTKILKKNPAKLRGIHLSLNAHKLQPVHSSTPHLYIHNIESITLGCEVRGIYPLDISPRPGQREVKQFLREGQGTTAQRGSASRLASHSPRAPRDRQTSNVSSDVREVPTPASTLTPGCLLLPTLQKEKKKAMPGSIHHSLSNWAGGAGVSKEVTSRSPWGLGSGGRAGGDSLEFFPP